MHTSEIVAGYEKSFRKVNEILEGRNVKKRIGLSIASFLTRDFMAGLVCHEVKDPRDQGQLVHAVKSVLAAKQFGYEDVLAPLVAEACLIVMPSARKTARVNVDNVRVSKIMGGNVSDSEVVKGMVVQRDAEGMIKKAEKAKIAVFGCGIEQVRVLI